MSLAQPAVATLKSVSYQPVHAVAHGIDGSLRCTVVDPSNDGVTGGVRNDEVRHASHHLAQQLRRATHPTGYLVQRRVHPLEYTNQGVMHHRVGDLVVDLNAFLTNRSCHGVRPILLVRILWVEKHLVSDRTPRRQVFQACSDQSIGVSNDGLNWLHQCSVMASQFLGNLWHEAVKDVEVLL